MLCMARSKWRHQQGIAPYISPLAVILATLSSAVRIRGPKMMSSSFDRPELVFGLVGALGTDLEKVEDALAQALLAVGYGHRTVRVSAQIATAYTEIGLAPLPEGETPLDTLMDQGDALRRYRNDGATTAAIAIAAISDQRHEDFQGEDTPRAERNSIATIIRQLKHPDEVDLLRSVYGARFVLLGVWTPRAERVIATHRRLRELSPNRDQTWYDQQVPRLMNRDEQDGSHPLGQRVRDTFELADAYIALRAGYEVSDEVGRVVRLLFGAPFETPTRDEQGMFQAFGARLRSSAGGRQVGAVVVDMEGELVASGTNDVPKAGGGQYWTGDRPDHRDFQGGVDFNDQEKLQVVLDLVERLSSTEDWLSDDFQKLEVRTLAELALKPNGPFHKSRVADLLEFGRILHAEMALICTAARRGNALAGLTMYTTTYPCHECARLIIGSGICRVVYVDPYPKSLVPRMYATEIGEGLPGDDKVAFEAFAGIAPRLFPNVFAMTGRERNPVTGEYVKWIPGEAQPRLVDASVLRYPIQIAEDEITTALFNIETDGESLGIEEA